MLYKGLLSKFPKKTCIRKEVNGVFEGIERNEAVCFDALGDFFFLPGESHGTGN